MLEIYIDNCVNEILNYPNANWDFELLSKNPNISFKVIDKNMDKPWNWDYLSQNPDITLKIIENNMDKPWNWASTVGLFLVTFLYNF
jgi:hypothetical protein